MVGLHATAGNPTPRASANPPPNGKKKSNPGWACTHLVAALRPRVRVALAAVSPCNTLLAQTLGAVRARPAVEARALVPLAASARAETGAKKRRPADKKSARQRHLCPRPPPTHHDEQRPHAQRRTSTSTYRPWPEHELGHVAWTTARTPTRKAATTNDRIEDSSVWAFFRGQRAFSVGRRWEPLIDKVAGQFVSC